MHRKYLHITENQTELHKRMKGTMMMSQVPPEPEPAEGYSTVPSETSPPLVLKSHHQHLANYVKLFPEEGENLSMGDNPAVPLVTEVFIHCFTIYD